MVGIRLNTERLMLDCTMLITEPQMLGHHADGLLLMRLHSSILLHTPPTGIQSATQQRLLRWLNQDISAQLSVSNGLIWWFARQEIFHFLNKVWATLWVTSVFSKKLLLLLSSATFHGSMLVLVPEWLLSHTSSSHPSPSSLPFSCMMNWERFGLDKVWLEKMVVSDWEVGSSRILTIDH